MIPSGGRVRRGRRVAFGWALVAASVACGSPDGVQASAALPEAGSVATSATPTRAVPPATSGPVETPLPTPTAIVVPPAPPSTAMVMTPDSEAPTVGAVAAQTAQPTASPAASAAQPTPRPPATPAAPTAVPTSTSNLRAVMVANGSEVYTLNCANCHGENGLGSQYRGIWGASAQYSNAGLTAELTSGHPFTFGFADKLSADEIASVVAYVLATF